jgi:hypothetical protein
MAICLELSKKLLAFIKEDDPESNSRKYKNIVPFGHNFI